MNTVLSQLITSAFGTSADAPPTPARRRKKLWEIASSRHCLLIGTCLHVGEMRKIAARVGYPVDDMSDYTLHTAIVSSCDSRSELTEAVQRHFEKRHAAAIARFAAARDTDTLVKLWRDALAHGADIAGALWAAWTHPALDEEAATRIFGDMHMLSHQVGSEARADLKQLEAARAEAARLRSENEALRRGLAEAHRAHDKALAQQQRELAVAVQRAAHFEQREYALASAAAELRVLKTVQQRAAALAGRAEMLEERNAENARKAARLELELLEAREELGAAEQLLHDALGITACEGVTGTGGCGRACPAEIALAGRCILCIGGRTGMVPGYRRVVEQRGGRFLHHDGGEEESLHRIDAVVSTADAIVCQAGCVSHQAYWRLKEACKKLGKPCVFVQSPGVASFARSLSAFAGTTERDTRFRTINAS